MCLGSGWFVPVAPTMLKAGACAAETAGRLELADLLERPPTEDATAFVFLTADITPFTMLTACAAYNIKNGIAFGKPNFKVSDKPVAAFDPAFAPSSEASAAVVVALFFKTPKSTKNSCAASNCFATRAALPSADSCPASPIIASRA